MMLNDISNNNINSSGEVSGGENISIPIIHEEVMISKDVVEKGKVILKKNVSTVEEFINVPLAHEEIDIKRIAFNKIVSEAPEAVRYEGDTMIISVLKEVQVVSLMLVEEVHVTRKNVTLISEQKVPLRHEAITVERTGDVHTPSR